MAANIDKEERVLKLAITLLNSRVGMTKSQILSKIVGYDAGASTETASKMFERDKRELRDLGFDIETRGADGAAEDIRYRIESPADPQYAAWFTPLQLKVLTLAASLWHTAAPMRDIITARIRLRALGADIDGGLDALGDALLPDTVLHTVNNAKGHEALTEALATRRIVRFTYRSAASGATTKRQVEPWRIIARPTGWYLVARDIAVGEPRVFHFDRMIGAPSLGGREDAYVPPTAAVIDEAAAALSLAPQREAQLLIDRDKGQALRARASQTGPGNGGSDLVTVPYVQDIALARELAAYGPHVEVVAPDSLRDQVVALLHAAAGIEAGK